MKKTVFDIETRAQADLNLREIWEEALASVPANYKDEAKIQAKAEEIFDNLVEKAPLSALTGEICAIGYTEIETEQINLIHGKSEADILTEFFTAISTSGALNSYLIGFNSKNFDVPFILQRAWKLGLKIPQGIMETASIGRLRLSAMNIDLMEAFNFGARAFVSLDKVARFLGVGRKTGNGAQFWELYNTDKEAALAYLANDVKLTEAIYNKMYNF